MIDYICISGSLENRVAEFVSHLHEHFENPSVVRNGHYTVPEAPGYGITMKSASLREFEFPEGPVWAARARKARTPSRAWAATSSRSLPRTWAAPKTPRSSRSACWTP
jgi:hypothetical protein